MVEEIKELLEKVEYRLLGIRKSNIKIVDFFARHFLNPCRFLSYGIRNSFISVFKFLISFLILYRVVGFFSQLDGRPVYPDFIYLLLTVTFAGVFAFVIPPSQLLFKKIKPQILRDIEGLVKEVEANKGFHINRARDTLKMFEEKMISRIRCYRYILGIIWGSIIFIYEKIINGVPIIDDYFFILLTVFATITWMIIESYSEANKLVFLYLDIAVLNCQRENVA